MRHYTVILTPEEHPDGQGTVYNVEVPALPSAITWGESFDHALEMARDVIELTLDVMHDDHEPLPDDVADLPDGIDLRYAITLHFYDPAERLAATA